MTLNYLQVSPPTHKGAFLQHIHELVHIKLDSGDTYNSLFTKLGEEFKDAPLKLTAAESWIQGNREHQEDQSVFETVLVEEDGLYAIFNLIPDK